MRSHQLRRLAKSVERLQRSMSRAGRTYGGKVSIGDIGKKITSRSEIKKELIYRYQTLTFFAEIHQLNLRLVYDFFGGRNNNRSTIEALQSEGFKSIPLVGRTLGQKVAA